MDKTSQEWQLPSVEVVFATGDFVELESKGEASTAEATTRRQKFVTDLGVELGEPVNRGYLHILLGRKH